MGVFAIFLIKFDYFGLFKVNKVTVSTCVDWTQGTGLPIRGTVRKEQVYHIPNMTMQLAKTVHLGWVFIFEVDLFPHTSKALFFTALPPIRAFSQQKRGFPAFLRSRKSVNFYRFLAFFSCFSYLATPQSQHDMFEGTYQQVLLF